jgi:hypothetical protein
MNAVIVTIFVSAVIMTINAMDIYKEMKKDEEGKEED